MLVGWQGIVGALAHARVQEHGLIGPAACGFAAAQYASAPTHTYPCGDARKTTKALRDAAQAAPDYHAPMDFPHAHGINLYS